MCCSALKWPAAEPARFALTKAVLPLLQPGMLCLADRNFFGYALWKQAQATGADLLWRVKAQQNRLPCEQRLPDGSYLSCIYPSDKDRRCKANGIKVRVIEYELKDVEGCEPIYRLVTTISIRSKLRPGNSRLSITNAGRSKRPG